MSRRESIPILLADDDFADRSLIVNDGEELMDYLRRLGKYANAVEYPDPGILLLDLKHAPKKRNRALSEIREDLKLTPYARRGADPLRRRSRHS